MSDAFRYSRPEGLDLESEPRLSVAIIVACRGGRAKLDLTLASLAALNYPADLHTVYVVDDGSDPKLSLPDVRPTHTNLTYFPNEGSAWGKAAASNFQVLSCTEDVLWFIDADLVVHPDHLAHHMKWHHESDDYLVLGWKRFVEQWDYHPDTLHQSLINNEFDSLHSESLGHDYWEARVDSTDQLRNPGLESFRALVGATFSMTRKNWNEIGGYNPDFRTAEDNELGWRSMLHGMRFVPEGAAKSWHLGITTFENNRELMLEHNNPNLANYIPELSHLRGKSGIHWAVPETEVFLDCRDITFKDFMSLVGQLTSDVKGQAIFHLFGPWPELETRYKFTDDPNRDLRQIQRWVSSDPRFSFIVTRDNSILRINEILDFIEILSTPFILFAEGNIGTKVQAGNLKASLLKAGTGLEGAVDSIDNRIFMLFAPAVARAKLLSGDTYKNLERTWGVHWNTLDALNKPYRNWYFRVIPFGKYSIRRLFQVRSIEQLRGLFQSAYKIFSARFSKK
ncbi:MAG TPA: glycosyltransferase [Candidatus Nanopelagicaceae bacterium]|nr:glycosyltransferase [Candidatus Nanopelagicaceae bacterium]